MPLWPVYAICSACRILGKFIQVCFVPIMPISKNKMYKVSFVSQGQVYAIYARQVAQGTMSGFIEIGELAFDAGGKAADPAEAKLREAFFGVKRCFMPLHSVLRIGEMAQEGPTRLHALSDGGVVRAFPGAAAPRSAKPGGKPGS